MRLLAGCSFVALIALVSLPSDGLAASGVTTRAPALELPLFAGPNASDFSSEYKAGASAPEKTDRKQGQQLRLDVRLGGRVFEIGDALSLTLSTNKTCELNIIYKQANGDTVVFPEYYANALLLGDATLRKGETRHIPVSPELVLEITPPSGIDELTIQCRVDGLGDRKIKEKDIRNWDGKDGDAFRGLSAKVLETSRRDPQSHFAQTFDLQIIDREERSAEARQ